MAMEETAGRRRILLAFVATAVLGLLWLAVEEDWLSSPSKHHVLAIYGYSSLDEVMTQGVFPAFRRQWQEQTGEKLEFLPTFAGSGEITRRILDRYPAEIAIVSSELDAYRLPVPFESWKQSPHGGLLARTPLVIVTRTGNPHAIASFTDLTQQDISLIHADPATSGLANLALIALYHEAVGESGSSEQGRAALADYGSRVKVQVASAREAHLHFSRGEADAFITYEQDVVTTPTRPGVDGEILMPVHTLIVEPVVVRIDKNISVGQRDLVDSFLEYLWSYEGQKILVDYGFRSVSDNPDLVNPDLATPREPITLQTLGGATAVKRTILDPILRGKLPGVSR